MADETRRFCDPEFGFAAPEGLRLLSVLGGGNRSQWFEAEQIRLNRTVAVKFLRPNLAEDDAIREAFLEAGRQAAGIIHHAALPIINVFRKYNCIVMHRCRGNPLREFSASIPPLKVAAIGEAIMDCLSSLHATGRCHGNLSSGNVFLDEEGGVWINDFFQPPLSEGASRPLLGDQRFIPPEILTGGAGDWSADVFSLGRLLADIADPSLSLGELGSLLEAMQDPEPARRGWSPDAVMDDLRRIRLNEEARLGLDPAGRRGKRMYRRVPAEFAVSLRRRSATPEETAGILMKIRDIGESGVFVETDDDLIGVGSILELDFGLKGVEGNVHAFGIVRWCSSPPMPRGVGVQFVEVDQSGLAKLRQFLGSSGTRTNLERGR